MRLWHGVRGESLGRGFPEFCGCSAEVLKGEEREGARVNLRKAAGEKLAEGAACSGGGTRPAFPP